MPPNGTTEEQNQILENLASQGYDGIAVSVIAPNDQVPVLNKIADKTNLITFDSDAPKSNRLLYIGTNNYEAGKSCWERRSSSCLPNGGKIAVFVGTLLGRQRGAAPEGYSGRHRRPQDRHRRQARGQHRSRQGPLERRGHRQRQSAISTLVGRPLDLQRPGHRRGARRPGQEGQGHRGSLRRRGRHAERHRRRRHPGHRGAEALPCSAICRANGCTISPPRARQPSSAPADHDHRHRRRGHQQGQRRRVQEEARRDEEVTPRQGNPPCPPLLHESQMRGGSPSVFPASLRCSESRSR